VAQPSIVVCAFGLKFSPELRATFVQLTHTRITARALQIALIDHDHGLIEHIVQLVLVERCSHRVSLPQRVCPPPRCKAKIEARIGVLGPSVLGGCELFFEDRFSRRSSFAIRSSCCAT